MVIQTSASRVVRGRRVALAFRALELVWLCLTLFFSVNGWLLQIFLAATCPARGMKAS